MAKQRQSNTKFFELWVYIIADMLSNMSLHNYKEYNRHLNSFRIFSDS